MLLGYLPSLCLYSAGLCCMSGDSCALPVRCCAGPEPSRAQDGVLQVTRGKALLLLGGYVVYVLTVCAADIVHRVRQQSAESVEL